MKILEIHKYHKIGGGADKAFLDNIKLFKEKGHEVIVFSMNTPDAIPSEFEKYFIKHKNYHSRNLFHKIAISFSSIYSKETYQKLNRLIKEHKPDIAHIHNYMYQLTPSILLALKENNIPIVNTLHDYYPLCPNYVFYNNRNNKICEKCKGKKFYNAFFSRCMKNSWAVSFLGMLNAYYWNHKKVYDLIDLFIAPSQFIKNKMVEYGFSENKITIIPNFIVPFNKKLDCKDKNFILYIGSFTPAKGIYNLINAFNIIDTHTKLYICGDNSLTKRLQKLIKINNRIKFLGFLPLKELWQLLNSTKFVVVPSICYENYPYAALEAFVSGKTVLASKIGGVPEIIENGKTGLLFQADDVNDLAEKLKIMLSFDDIKIKEMGENSLKRVLNINNKEKYYNQMIEIFKMLSVSKDKEFISINTITKSEDCPPTSKSLQKFMKILEIHKYHKIGGGADKAFLDNIKLFKEKGHEVIVFSMNTPDAIPSEFEKYFIKHKNYHSRNLFHKIAISFSSIYSKETYQKLNRLIKEHKPDIAHIHNYMYQLTPSILLALKENNIPIVNTLHDYYPLCPNYVFYNNRNNKICEKCKGKKFYNAFFSRCMKNSWAVSFLGMLNAYYWNHKKVYDLIDLFIAPSQFIKNKMVEYGFSENKIIAAPYFLEVVDNRAKKTPENFILYTGLFLKVKGVHNLIEAFQRLNTDTSLYLAGKGSYEFELKKLAKAHKSDKIKFLGFLDQKCLFEYIQKAKFLIVPSLWYENYPYSASEAFSNSKTVLGAKIGGIPEMIDDRKTGLLFQADDVNDLAEKLKIMLSFDDIKIKEMGENSLKRVLNINNKEKYYNQMIEIFKTAYLNGSSNEKRHKKYC